MPLESKRTFKIGHKKDTCLKEIRLCAQNLLIILGSIINVIEGQKEGYVTFLQLTINGLLIVYNNSRPTSTLYGIDHGFFKYICGGT
jgi:hypothetical protein